MKAIDFKDETSARVRVVEIPEDLRAEAESYREQLIEAVAESDDALLEKYLHGGKVEARRSRPPCGGPRSPGDVQPVVCGSAFKNKGIQQLLDAVVDYLPSPSTSRRSSATTTSAPSWSGSRRTTPPSRP